MKVKNNTNNVFLTLIPLLVILLLLPFILAFDSVIYFITKPSCLNCGSLVGFIQNGSLTVHLIGGLVGYKLFDKK